MGNRLYRSTEIGKVYSIEWKGAILAAAGLFIEWKISALLGVILIGVGFMLAKDSPISGNKITATVLLVIGVILFLINLFA